MSKKKIIYIAVLAILIIIGAGLAWYVFFGGETTQDNKSQSDTTVETAKTPTKDLLTIIESNTALSNFNKLLSASGVKFTLQTVGTKYLVLASNNNGFKSLPDGYFDSLLTTEKQQNAQDINKYHVAIMPTSALANKQKIKTLNGQEVIVGLSGDEYTFTDAKGVTAKAVGPAQLATNGTIYVIDTVLLPQ